MPNWCSNDIVLTGPKDLIEEIAATKLSLDVLFPCPKELKDTVAPALSNDKEKAEKNLEKYGYADWYDWQIENWGTKWDIGPIEDLSVEEASNSNWEIRAAFDSAWSPPVEAMEKLYEKYKDRGLNIHMEYFESGCAFLGTVVTEKGVFKDKYREYKSADELESAVNELEHNLAQYEVEYMRELEAEEAANLENKSTVTEPVKNTKPAKKSTKKPVKSVKKTKPAKKPGKKPAKKATKKTIKSVKNTNKSSKKAK